MYQDYLFLATVRGHCPSGFKGKELSSFKIGPIKWQQICLQDQELEMLCSNATKFLHLPSLPNQFHAPLF